MKEFSNELFDNFHRISQNQSWMIFTIYKNVEFHLLVELIYSCVHDTSSPYLASLSDEHWRDA